MSESRGMKMLYGFFLVVTTVNALLELHQRLSKKEKCTCKEKKE